MIKWILQKIVGSKNQRELRRIKPTVARINEVEEALQREPEEKLRELTTKWQTHLARYHDLEIAPKPAFPPPPPPWKSASKPCATSSRPCPPPSAPIPRPSRKRRPLSTRSSTVSRKPAPTTLSRSSRRHTPS
jgi:hypothetical protein